MFLQNIAVAARARGLDTCHMAVFAQFAGPIRRLLGLPESDVVVCGVALGYEDRDFPANQLRTERVPAAAFTDFRGL
jgi:nitroreductase